MSLAIAAGGCLPADWGADMIVRPWRRPLAEVPAGSYRDLAFQSDGLTLRGWFFPAAGPRRGLIVYLHGMSDNRHGVLGIAARFAPKGYDVLAYDSRGQGVSDGEYCTYGAHERRDVSAALDAVRAKDAILFGSSLGAAVALQAAPGEPRVRGVIAQSSFSDLASIVAERAPWYVTSGDVRAAEALAERKAAFRVQEASPLAAAPRIRVPVLLIHGAEDRETRPVNSQRIYDALTCPRRLVLVPGAGHNNALTGSAVWETIVAWVTTLP